jgi:hypothetical protein
MLWLQYEGRQFGMLHNEELSSRRARKLWLDLSWETQKTDIEF